MTPLLQIDFPSIYKKNDAPASLPRRMAWCPPDMKSCLLRAADAVRQRGGELRLSDLFRSYDMQLNSHNDFVSKRKRAFSPPPGGSLHEAGRALDLDLDSLGMTLRDFWGIATDCSLTPIIDTPNPRRSEAWHFECRGSHALVYDHYRRGRGNNFRKPYEAMAASAIISVGIRHDKLADREKSAYLQSALIRLGYDIGNMDGRIGPRTREGLHAAGLKDAAIDAVIAGVDDLLQRAFPQEFFQHVTHAAGLLADPVRQPSTAAAFHDGDSIADLAASSPIARFRWKDRGRAPPGYIKGMALAFAESCSRLRLGDARLRAMCAPRQNKPALDALDWYGDGLDAAGADDASDEDRLVAVFALLLGLGMRESSGQHCEGRDMSAENATADTAEAGLFQVSYNSASASPHLKSLITEFSGRTDLLDSFDDGVACRASSWRNWGTGEGEKFQALTKNCPLFAVLYAGVLTRLRRKHWGPINRRKVEILPEAVRLFEAVRLRVQAP